MQSFVRLALADIAVGCELEYTGCYAAHGSHNHQGALRLLLTITYSRVDII